MGTQSRSVGGFVQAWMIQFRSLISEVLIRVNAEIRSQSEQLSSIVRQMPLEDILRRVRVDGIPLERARLQPSKVRKRFHK